MKNIPPEQRADYGKGVNALKEWALNFLGELDEKMKAKELQNRYEAEKITYSKETVIGALAEYISTENDKFQPMNANFGILPSLEINIKDKKERYSKLAEKSLQNIKNIT